MVIGVFFERMGSMSYLYWILAAVAVVFLTGGDLFSNLFGGTA